MKKYMSYKELKKKFRDFEYDNAGDKHLTGYVLIDQNSFDKDYSEEERTYEVSSNNKAFLPNKGGYSIFAYCLGDDDYCRLEWYIEDERRGGTWKIEKCWMEE